MISQRDGDSYTIIVNELSRLLCYAYSEASGEQSHPGADNDSSDDKINMALKRAQVLRELRHRFEVAMTEVLQVPEKST